MNEKEILINDFMKKLKPEDYDRILRELRKKDVTPHEPTVLTNPQSLQDPYPL
jgi:uncharacterized protein YutE (UPF0331/DUF86 family)